MVTEGCLRIPGTIYSGSHALEQIKNILTDDIKKVAVFTDKGIQKAGLLDKALEYIKEKEKEVVILNELEAEPSCDHAQKIIEEFKSSQADFIIAIGGGSVMDMAKLASILKDSQYKVRDLIENPLLGEKTVKSLMIPTTAGTGAEATPNSIVAVPEKELKVGIVNPAMIADYVILDVEMIKKLPRSIAAATGVDALAHAIECFTSKKANQFSDTFALEALDLIMNHLERAYHNPEDEEAGSAMLIGAFYAGIAITSSGTTAVHALSYPLGGKYHIAHGVANAMLLVPVMKFNQFTCQERLARAYDRITHGFKEWESEKQKAQWMINRMDEIVKNLKIPVSLGTYGVQKEDLEELVASGMNVQRLLQNNMREVTAEDARQLYLEIM